MTSTPACWAYRHRVRITLALTLAAVAFTLPAGKVEQPVVSTTPRAEAAALAPETVARKLVRRALSDSEIRVVKLIWKNFEPRHFTTAVLVANCESTLGRNQIGPKNRNGTQDFGVFQMNNGGTLQSLGGTRSLALNVEWNIRAAARLKERSGWTRWVCYNKLRKSEAMERAERYTKMLATTASSTH
jgi:hypothetical protein